MNWDYWSGLLNDIGEATILVCGAALALFVPMVVVSYGAAALGVPPTEANPDQLVAVYLAMLAGAAVSAWEYVRYVRSAT